ncbi:MAG: hypothetical protein ACRDK0_06950 [Solirubrobacteraceae bacterium]
MIPRRLAQAALVVAAVSYLAWQLAATDDSGGIAILTLVTAAVFWLSVMVLVAFAVQRGVARRRDRDHH